MGAGSRRRSVSVSIFAVSPLRLCLRSHLDWQCYKINTLRAGQRGVVHPDMRGVHSARVDRSTGLVRIASSNCCGI